MKSALLHKRVFTGFPGEVEILEAGGDRLFEVDSLRQPGLRMLVALSEEGTKDYPVYDPDKKKVKFQNADSFGKKFKDAVKKHMKAETEAAETPEEEEEATNDPALRQAASLKTAKMGKCTKCGEERSLNRDRICHECQQNEWDEEKEKTAAVSATRPMTCEIRDEMDAPESVGHVYTTAEAVKWFQEQGVPFDAVVSKDDGINTTFTYQKTAFAAQPRIKRNAWDNWYGYIGNKRVEQFFNSPYETQEEAAKKWLAEQQALMKKGSAPKKASSLECPACGTTEVICPECGYRTSIMAPMQSHCPKCSTALECVGCSRMVADDGLGIKDNSGEHQFVRTASVHDIKPLVNELRNAEHEDSKGLVAQLIDITKSVGATELREAAKHYLATLQKINDRKETGSVPRRSQRAADDAWKRLESAYVHFVR